MAVPPRPAATGRPDTVAAVPAPRAAPGSSPAGAGPVDAGIAGLAWIVREVTHVPGVLRLADGRLSFESTRRVLFDGTPADLGLELGRSPRSGLHVTTGAERLRVCVVRPPGAVAPCRELVEHAAGGRPSTTGEPGAWQLWWSLLAPPQPARSRARRFTLPRAAQHASRACPS